VDSSGYGAPDMGPCHQGGHLNETMLASFLIQAQPNQYWACFTTQGGFTMPGRSVQTALPPWFDEYHLRVISIQTEILTWLRFPYIFESWCA
jgi:hypothetical protein